MIIHTRNASLITDKGRYGDWYVKVLLGIYRPPFNKGAGYIGGCTIYVAWRCVDHVDLYRPRRRLQVGITRNANRVPWTRH